MKVTSTLIVALAATPALAHHENHVATFSPLAAGIVLALIATVMIAAPRLRAALTRVTAR